MRDDANSRALQEWPATSERREVARVEWLPFLDTYRTMCLAPPPEFQRVPEEVRSRVTASADGGHTERSDSP
jgi:hypothetical protein